MSDKKNEKTKIAKDKKAKRQRTNIEVYIVMPGQFRTLGMISIVV